MTRFAKAAGIGYGMAGALHPAVALPAQRWLMAFWVGPILAFATSASAQNEQTVKAAFIFNFAKYITWPDACFDSGSAPIIIGEVGSDDLDGALEATVSGRTVDGRRVVVRHMHWGQNLAACHVLFVPASEMGNAGSLNQLKDRPVLMVGETPGFARRFGGIGFYIDANHLRFEINAAEVRESGLTVSSKLLALGKPPPG